MLEMGICRSTAHAAIKGNKETCRNPGGNGHSQTKYQRIPVAAIRFPRHANERIATQKSGIQGNSYRPRRHRARGFGKLIRGFISSGKPDTNANHSKKIKNDNQGINRIE
jgi:hypothetical protein